MQGTRVQALVHEDPTWRGTTNPVHHNYWACTLEPASHSYWAHVPQLLKPACLEPGLHNKRSHRNEMTAHRDKKYPLLSATREKPTHSKEDPTQPKINKFIKNITVQKSKLWEVSHFPHLSILSKSPHQILFYN